MIRLTLRAPVSVPIEAPCIVPDRIAHLSNADIGRLPLLHGNRRGELGEYFQVDGDPADACVEVVGPCERVKWLGAGMNGGELRCRGSIGMHAGSGMTGGVLTVDGDADDWLGAEMRGGLIRVRGRAGGHAAAAYPGSRRGMRGGEVLIDGPAGDGVVAVMRRGLVAVGGGGDFAGASMIAGSLLVFGSLGRFAGAAMKRGTIAAFGPPPELLPTFRHSCTFDPLFIEMYLRKLRAHGYAPAHRAASGPMERFCGDHVGVGLGEILVCAEGQNAGSGS